MGNLTGALALNRNRPPGVLPRVTAPRQAPLDVGFAALALAAALVAAWTGPELRPPRVPCAGTRRFTGAERCDWSECLGCTCWRRTVRAALDRSPRRIVADHVVGLRPPR